MITLNQVYKELDFKSGTLLDASDAPAFARKQKNVSWIENGEWLSAAKRAGAEKVFFVENNPVVIFSKIKSNDIRDKITTVNKAWCLARPRILFLESPGELHVIDLVKKPLDPNTVDEESLRKQWEQHLIILEQTAQVSEMLQKYHRNNIESGRIFEEKNFGDLTNRADVSLIRDLRTVRKKLIEQGLSATFAHALIGRSIFVRYLEDRQILIDEDYTCLAKKDTGRMELLQRNIAGLEESKKKSYFVRILEDRIFTYDLFDYLAAHFNGDTFPCDENEQNSVAPKHLKIVQEMLRGNLGEQKGKDIQKPLFFYAYDFNVIPLDLISSIYEEFYSLKEEEKKKTKRRADGAYYTPSVLAEFVCSRVLTPEVLEKKPRILDPACGSGIFLVEAFRRIVRYRIAERPTEPLTFNELREIIRNQITGIEVNSEAANIAAFSLCLAMLNYLNPPDIRTQIYGEKNKLPCLLASKKQSKDHFHCILAENTFEVEKIESEPIWKKRFGTQCTDVIIGNPPWGCPGKDAPKESIARHKVLTDWASKNNKPIGDKEASQVFLWRSLDFLKPNGFCGLLVPVSVLTKQGKPSQQFRQKWFSGITVQEIFNFSHARKFFFHNSISPFLFISLINGKLKNNGFAYWSIKANPQTMAQFISVSVDDRHWLSADSIENQTIWKTLLYCSSADVDLINRLQYTNQRFGDFVVNSGQGLKVNPPEKDASNLRKYKLLDSGSFSRYGNFTFGNVPQRLYHLGNESMYSGKRILVKRGITEDSFPEGTPKGTIIARYEDMPFAYTSSINCFILKDTDDWKYKVFLGIFWSSLARYFFFNTSSMWGVRNSEIHMHEILKLPIIFPKTQQEAKPILQLVNSLRKYNPSIPTFFKENGTSSDTIASQRNDWENKLDEAVFDLYRLNNQERDLIRDCCNVTIPYFYDPRGSQGGQSIDDKWLKNYADVFCRRWEPYLDEGTKMLWYDVIGADGNMAAVHFYIVDQKVKEPQISINSSWDKLLVSLEKSTKRSLGISQLILKGIVHVLTDDGIIIIKYNEKRFWTKSKAREDAESTLCQSMMEETSLLSVKGGKE